FSSRRRHTRLQGDWSSDVCSSDLNSGSLAIVALRRWASEPLFLQRSVTFCLLAETTATLSAALVGDARTFEITVPVPDEHERYAYLAGRGSRPETFAVVDARRVAILTAGLTRLHLESLLAEAEAGGAPLDQDALT